MDLSHGGKIYPCPIAAWARGSFLDSHGGQREMAKGSKTKKAKAEGDLAANAIEHGDREVVWKRGPKPKKKPKPPNIRCSPSSAALMSASLRW